MADYQTETEIGKHTPGPWIAHNTSLNKHFWVISAANHHGAEFQPIAPTRIRVAEIKSWSDKSEVESEANARLIAAPLDLLAALELFVKEYVAMVDSGDCGFWDAEEEPKVIQARAAIAKARGEG